MICLKILFQIFRNRALYLIVFVDELSSALLYDAYIADELSVLTDRHMDRSDLLAVELLKLLNDRTERNIIVVHLCYIEHTRQISLFAEFPCFLCSDLNAVLTGNEDDCCIRNADCLLYFTDKIKVTGCIENIYFYFIPFNRNDRAADRELSFDLFLIIVTDGISVSYITHAVRNATEVCHSFCKGCFARTAVTK